MRFRATSVSTVGVQSLSASAWTRSTGANCSAVVLRTVA
jgi:hypothetical protein